MRKLSWICLLCLCGAAGSPLAGAHTNSTSFLAIQIADGRAVQLRWDVALHDLVWSVYIDANYDGVATAQEIEAARSTIISTVPGQVEVTRGAAACVVGVRDFETTRRLDEDFLAISLVADCPRPGPLTIGGALWMTGDPSQRVMLTATRGGEQLTGAIGPDSPAWLEPERPSAWASFARFVHEGIWHVLIGYDHIAFILLLLLPSVLRPVEGRWQGATGMGQVTRDIVTIVTAFTIAHSTTLALAVTRTVVLPTQPVEVAIAASIAVAGLINLFPRMSRLRLALAFGFGLVHGFGFANVLGELDTGGSSLLPLLAGFNIGVELAQLGIVALVLPVIYSMRATRWYAGGVMPLGSCALGAAGFVWLVQRLQ